MTNVIVNGNVMDLRNVSKVYENHSGKYVALDNINLSASKGELVLLLGPSGSGKTTLLTIAAGFNKHTSGDVFLFGKNINEYTSKELQTARAEKIGFIFQAFLLIESLSVYENVELVLRFSNIISTKRRERTIDTLRKTGILHLAKKLPCQLSHGEKQRTAIARAFANDAEILIADEPSASLASEQGEEIIKLLHSYASVRNKCVIVASHDLRLIPLADRIIGIENGKITTAEHTADIKRKISQKHNSLY